VTSPAHALNGRAGQIDPPFVASSEAASRAVFAEPTEIGKAAALASAPAFDPRA